MAKAEKYIKVESSLSGRFNLGFHRGQVVEVPNDVDAETAEQIVSSKLAVWCDKKGNVDAGAAIGSGKDAAADAKKIIAEAQATAKEIIENANAGAEKIIAEAKETAHRALRDVKENISVNDAQNLSLEFDGETATDKGAATAENR